MSKIIEERYVVRHKETMEYPTIGGVVYTRNILETTLFREQQTAVNRSLTAFEDVVKVRVTIEEVT